MRLFVKILMAGLVLGVGGLFVIKDMDGRPLLRFDDLRWPAMSLPELPNVKPLFTKAEDALPPGKSPQDRVVKVYKWKDAKGVWHFSDAPNPQGASATLDVDPNINVVPGRPADPAGSGDGKKGDLSQSSEDPATGPKGMPLGRVPEIMEQTRDIQRRVDDKARKLDQF